jgi:hypothetical protein
MVHLKKEEVPIFLLYGLCWLTAWATSLSLLYHAVLEKKALEQIGYDKAVFLGISLIGGVYLAWRHKFLRPIWPKDRWILFWRLCQVVFGGLAIMCLGPLFMQSILMEINIVAMFNETVGVICFLACVAVIDKFIIPARRMALRQKRPFNKD